jgi:hypothetical protein
MGPILEGVGGWFAFWGVSPPLLGFEPIQPANGLAVTGCKVLDSPSAVGIPGFRVSVFADALAVGLPPPPHFLDLVSARTYILAKMRSRSGVKSAIVLAARTLVFALFWACLCYTYVKPLGGPFRSPRRLPRVAVHRQPRCSDLALKSRHAVGIVTTEKARTTSTFRDGSLRAQKPIQNRPYNLGCPNSRSCPPVPQRRLYSRFPASLLPVAA